MAILNNKLIIKNTIYLYARTFITIVVSLYTSRILLATLGVEDYGIFNVVGGVVATLAFFRAAISNGIQRFLTIDLGKEDHDGFKETYNCSLTVAYIVALCLFITCEIVGIWFLNTKMTIPVERIFAANIVLQASILGMLITVLQSPSQAVIIAYEKMNFYAYLSVFETVFKLLIVYLISVVSIVDSLILYSILYLLITFIIYIFNLMYVVHFFPDLKHTIGRNKQKIKELFEFSGWNIFGSLSGILKSNGINILMNIFYGPVVNAARGISFQVMTAINSFVTNFQIAAKPQTIQLYATKNIEATMELCYSTSRLSFFLILIFIIPFLFGIDIILKIWLGNNIPEYTDVFCKLGLLTVAIESLGNPISTLVHATGHLKNYQIVVSIINILIIPIAYVFLKLGFEPSTAMLVSLFIAPIAQLARLIMLKKILHYSILDYIKLVIIPCLKTAIIAMILSYLIFHIPMNSIIYNLVYIVLSVFVTTVCIYKLGLSYQEKVKIINHIKIKLDMVLK